MKKILVIDGHPDEESFCRALSDSYIEGATRSGSEIKRVNVRDLRFDPNLEKGYQVIQELEPDLLQSQRDIQWCDHLVIIFPMWWGGMPARLKGYFDRTWLPGFAFKYHQNDPFWDRLLRGRSARVIVTSDAPILFNFFVYWNSPYRVVEKMILRFCGFKPVRTTKIGGVKALSDKKIEAHLNAAKALGARGI